MDNQHIKILLVEDDASAATLIQTYLEEANNASFSIELASRLATALETLEKPDDIDLILLDLNLPDSSGIDTLISLRAKIINIPIIVVTGLDNEGLAYQAIQEGAQDYITKDEINTSTLVRSIRYAIERKRAELSFDQQAIYYSTLINEIGKQIASVLDLGSVLNQAARLVHNYFDYHHVALFLLDGNVLRLKAIAGSYEPYFPPNHTQRITEGINGWVATHDQKVVANNVNDEPRYTSLIAEHTVTQAELCVPINVAGKVVGVLDIQSPHLNAFSKHDITNIETIADQIAIAIENARLYERATQEIAERKRTEEALRESEQRFRAAITSISDVIYMAEITEDGRWINHYISPNVVALTGYPLENITDDWGFWDATIIHPEDKLLFKEQSVQLEKHSNSELEYRLVKADGSTIWVRDKTRIEKTETGKMLYGIISDITSHRQSQEEFIRLYVSERDRYQEAEALRKAAIALVSTVDLDQVIQRILVELHNVVPYDSASIQLLEGDNLRIIGGRGFVNTEELVGVLLSTSDNIPNATVLKAKEPVIVGNVQVEYAPFMTGPHVSKQIKGWLGVPMCIGTELIGMLTLDKQEENYYSELHAKTAAAYAAQAAVAIENARLHTETEARAQQLTVMHQLDKAISASLNVREIYEAFSKHTCNLLTYDRMSIVLLEEDTLRIDFASGVSNPPANTTFPIAGTASGWVIIQKQPLLIGDVSKQDDRFLSDVSWATGLKSVLVLPLQVKRQTIGTWNIGSCEVDLYTQEDLRIASLIADQLALGIENARLYEQAQQEITERKQAQELLEAERALLAHRVEERTAELSQANAQLERANRLKDEFLASMSHELRTPLSAVLGMAEALQEQTFGPLNEEQLDCVVEIEESGRHLLELINDILDLSKIEAGKSELIIDSVTVESVCQASLRLIKQTAQKKQLKVLSNFDSSVPTVEADERRLKQILVNLLSNAVKFTPSGGQVGLDVKADQEHGAVNFTIWDTGIGIAQEDMERLFKPFVQLDSSLSRQYPGTGLGLALVYRLTELHQGSVSLESEVDKGSKFTISLPWKRTQDASEDDELNEQTSNGSHNYALAHDDLLTSGQSPANAKATILLAEDSSSVSKTMARYLTSKGYHILTAANGADAIQQAKEFLPDMILMDIQMPIMDGLEATRNLRQDPQFANIPIIALTALAMPGDRERCLAAGANEYLSKPVSLTKLTDTIRTQLENAKQLQNKA